MGDEPVPCTNCGKVPAPSGTGVKYCKVKACQEVGIAAGHIKVPQQKRGAAGGHSTPVMDGGGDDMVAAVPPRGDLNKIDKIYGCRQPRPRALSSLPACALYPFSCLCATVT